MKNLYIALGGIALAVGILFYGIHLGKIIKQVDVDKANAKIVALTQKQQEKVDEITKDFTNKLAGVNGKLGDALRRLRDRPERSTEKYASTNCKGASGAELSRPDAEFLIGEASRADQQREALIACYHYADAIQMRK